MKPIVPLLVVSSFLAALSSSAESVKDWTSGFKPGPAPLSSAGQLTFGPPGILFVADPKGAAVVAFDTGDRQAAPAKPFRVDGINRKVAALLGTAPDQILIEDLAVNPLSHRAYLTVSRGRGPDAIPVLLRVDEAGQPEVVELASLKYARAEFPDAPADGVVGQGNRQSNPRLESITDLAFLEDRLLVAGLSNEEFASTLRAIPFPFRTVANGTGVEIYHGAHGRFETRAPIRTFVPYQVGNQPSLLAAYTCTPLVQLSLSELEPGAKVKGKTVAELGNRNRPLDIIVYQKDGKDFLLLANSSRGVLKVSTENLAEAAPIQEPVKDGATRGLAHETVKGWTGVDHLAGLDAQNALILRRGEGGAQNLESVPFP